MPEPIQFDDPRYQEARYNEFRSFEEGDKFLRNYCGLCRIKFGCDINKALRHAIVENFPFFHRELIRLDLKYDLRFRQLHEDLENRLPENIMACKRFESKQLTFAFAE